MADVSAGFPRLTHTPLLSSQRPALFSNNNPLGTGLLNLRPSVFPSRTALSLDDFSTLAVHQSPGLTQSQSTANPYSSSRGSSDPYARLVG